MSTFKNWTGAPLTAIAGATLNGLTSNTYASGSAINWQQGQSADGYLMGRVQLTFKFQTAPNINTGFSLWFLKSIDNGATYESNFPPARAYDLVFSSTSFGLSGDVTAHTVSQDTQIPYGWFKCLLKNDNTAQALTANNTDNVLTIAPLTLQVL